MESIYSQKTGNMTLTPYGRDAKWRHQSELLSLFLLTAAAAAAAAFAAMETRMP